MEANVREYYLMIISGTITMLSGGFVWPIFAPFVREQFTAPIQLVGLAVSGYFLLRMFSEFPIGVLSDRIGPKLPLIGGRILAVIGAFICYQTKSIWPLIFARIIWGMGDASFFCIGMSYVSRLFSSERRGRALGFFQAVELVGSFIGQTAGGFVAANYGPRINFLICSALGVVALVIVTFIKGIKEPSTPGESAPSLIPSKEEMLVVLNQTVITACAINLGCMLINNGLLGTVLPIYATEELLIPLDRYALLVSSSTVGSVAGNLLGGFLSDKMGRRKMLSGGLVTGLISIIGLSQFTGFYPLIAVMFLKGIFWGIVYGVIPAFIADAVPDYVRGKAIGTFRTFMDMGGLIGPIIMSSIVELSGVPQGYIYSFYFGVVLIAGMILLVLKLKE
ncbi:MFS transporter [Candidatus Bathyarchaeota archaeon]|nr:MFS transporter [Candidatus Bathyarchaeota archaeon]